MNREEWEQAFQEIVKNPESGKIEKLVDRGFRHQSDQSPTQYLEHFLRVGRHFGYATHDDSWGEFEKEYAIIIRRLVMAEAACKELMRSRFESDNGDPDLSDTAYFEAVRLAREAVGDYKPEKLSPWERVMPKPFEKLPKIQITQAEWDALLEYSKSVPTLREDGKRWKKYHEEYDRWTIWRYTFDGGNWYIETGVPEIVN